MVRAGARAMFAQPVGNLGELTINGALAVGIMPIDFSLLSINFIAMALVAIVVLTLVEGRRGSVCSCLGAIAYSLYDKIGSNDDRDKDKEGKPVLFHDGSIIKHFFYANTPVYTFLANLL